MTNRAQDWFIQATDDLKWGEQSLNSGFYSQTCFIAQQASEKSLKAICYHRGYDQVKSHSVASIANELKINGEILEAAKILDQYYISARYPDGLPEGAPCNYFTKKQAKEALEYAKLIIDKVANEFK